MLSWQLSLLTVVFQVSLIPRPRGLGMRLYSKYCLRTRRAGREGEGGRRRGREGEGGRR